MPIPSAAGCHGTLFLRHSAGRKLVLPGPKLDGASLYELFEQEGVTFTAGIPTVWLALLEHLQEKAWH